MYNLGRHPFFTKYIDPESGVESFVLTKKISGMQQHFYFSESSVTPDGKYLWIRCTWPPSWFPTLAVISLDADDPFYRHFPNAGIDGGCPCITPEGDGCYFPNDGCIWKVSLDGRVELVFKIEGSFVGGRRIMRTSTHSTVSCDGKYMIMDSQIGNTFYIIRGELATGECKVLAHFGRMYNHAQFCPTRPNLFILDQDAWRDFGSGEYMCLDNRIWLMDVDATHFEPLIPDAFYGRDGSEMCHDFWSDDGYLCWADYGYGAYECDVDTREINHVWKRPVCHCHTDPKRKMWVADQTPYEWSQKPCQVLFYDRETNREIAIFSALPEPPVFRGRYHVDPHPQFVLGGSLVVCTTTVLTDTATVALTPTDSLLKKCRTDGMEITRDPVEPPPPSWLNNRWF